ncbi:beta strand repeat-containing protein [Ramlibacter sp. PS4R-6]|uniref:beta strand repeat-containing protein n=1 Tax=Ramlibacter sp. PS4R-6 TaxID=3133438 RepID=UPI0030B0FCD2
MSLPSFNTNYIKGSYAADLLFFLKVSENNPLRLFGEGLGGNSSGLKPHIDSVQSVAIGYGYDLIQNKATAVADLQAAGATITNALQLQQTLNGLTTANSASLVGTLAGLVKLPAESNAEALLNVAVNQRVPAFNAFLQARNITLPDSKERATLFSMWYQTPKYFEVKDAQTGLMRPTTLTQQLIAGNRAEAWFQIRYGSAANGTQGLGIVARRFAESTEFGLTDGTPPGLSQAKQVYQMLQAHRDAIVTWEKRFGKPFDGTPSQRDLIKEANTTYSFTGAGTVQSIVENLKPLRDSLFAELQTTYPELATKLQAASTAVDPFNVYMAPKAGTSASLDSKIYQTGKFAAGAADLLVGDSAADALKGNDGADVLLGLGGKDVLDGGSGDDLLVGGTGDDVLQGGAGNDTYFIDASDGKDVISDADGVGTVMIGGANAMTLGVAVATGIANTWEVKNGTQVLLTIKFTGTTAPDGSMAGALQVDGPALGGANNSFTIQNWKGKKNQAGDLGITLQDAPAVKTVSGGAVTTEQVKSLLNGGSTPSTAEMGEGSAKTFTVVASAVDDLVQTVKAKVQGAIAGALYAVVGDDTIPFTNGEVTLTIAPGQNQVTFSVWEKGAITSDQTFTLSASLLDSSGNPIAQSNGLSVTVRNSDDPADPIQEPVTTNSIIKGGDNDTFGDTAANDLLDGGAGNDVISANAGGDDIIYGGIGDDDLAGGPGNNHVLGGSGRDTVQGGNMIGSPGNDVVEGGADADIGYGDDGKDRLYGDDYVKLEDAITQGNTAAPGAGQGDFMNGGLGDDTVVGSNRNDMLTGGPGKDVIVGGGGDDVIESDADFGWVEPGWTASVTNANNTYTFNVNGATLLWYGAQDDRVYAGAGNDGVTTGGGNDFIDAGTGNDTVFGEGGDDQVLAGDGDDVLVGDNGLSVTPAAQQGADFIDGGAGNDSVFGGGNNDALFGGDGNDSLVGDSYGLAGDDYINGEVGDDTVFGAMGRDTILGGTGNDALVGDNGGSDPAGDADLIDGGVGNDQLFGQGGDDTMQGGDGADYVKADAGQDVLDGGAGNDTMLGGDDDDRLAGGADIDGLDGGAGRDWVDGGAGADTVIGGADDDMLLGGDGNDRIQSDAGNDFADGGTGSDTITGNDGNDMLAGGDDADHVQGDAGSDQLDGGTGGDTVLGGIGQDLLAGGDGDDTIAGDNGGTDRTGDDDVLDGGAGNDQLYGQGGNDLLLGGDGSDWLQGDAGDDTLVGGTGDNFYAYNIGDGVDHIEDAGGNDRIIFGNGITFTNLQLGLGSLKITFAGQAGEIHIDHFDPNDPFGSGSIELFQFADKSVYSYAQLLAKGFAIGGTPDADELFGTALTDTINALESDDYVNGLAGNDALHGNAGNDAVFGGDGADHLWGDDGNDVLGGDAGADILEGGTGDDVYLFNLGDGQDTVIDNSGADSVSFGTGITAANLGAGRAGSDLVLSVRNTTDSLTIKDWFANPQIVNEVVLGDGTVLDRAGIADLMKNAAPVLVADTATAREDITTIASGNALSNDFDPEGRALRVTDAGTYAGTYGTLSLSSNGSYTYTLNNASTAVQSLAGGQMVTDTFTYTATDDDPSLPQTSSSKITVNISGNNDAPVTVADMASVFEDQLAAAVGNLLANDSDIDKGTTLQVANFGSQAGTYGTLTIGLDGSYSYTLNNGLAAVQALADGVKVTDHFTYVATDGITTTSSSFDVQVTGRNDAPTVVNALQDAAASGNFSYVVPANTFKDVDAGDKLYYSATLADGSALPSWLTFDAATATFSGRVPKGTTVPIDITVTAADRSTNTPEKGWAWDTFRITFDGKTGGGGGNNGGGGNGSGSQGNEGVGNGPDAPPPGHDYDHNDGDGTSPGNPGSQGGNGYQPHEVFGPPPEQLTSGLPGLGELTVGTPLDAPGAANGNGSSGNNGQHNGADNGNSTGNGNPLTAYVDTGWGYDNFYADDAAIELIGHARLLASL